MNNVDVSVIVPFYNNSNTIFRAISSVFNQTLLPKEIIIVNDKSKKKEYQSLKQILNSFDKKKIKIHILSLKKNSGPATARNIGWEKSSFKYIAFLDADDSWHIRKIEIQYKFMENKNIFFSAHNSTYKYRGTFNNYDNNYNFRKISVFNMFLYNQFTTPTVMMRRSVPLRFENQKYYTEDYLLWLEILLNKYHIYLIELTLTYLHKPSIGVSGLSRNLKLMRGGEIMTFKSLLKNNYIKMYLFKFLMFYSYLKEIRRRIFYHGRR
jgi:glycosyltransferase involved in cell wall biosynthesis